MTNRLQSIKLPPDAALCVDPAYGGQVHIDADDYFAGPPEFVAEIAKSSEIMTCTTNYRFIDGRESANISLCACATPGSIGSGLSKADISQFSPTDRAFSRVQCFPASGSIPPPC